MDKEVEKLVKSCKSCIIVSSLEPPEPLKRTLMPERAWVDLAADFVGPLPSGHNLLVIVDYFSRFIEVIVMNLITAALTVQALHETFCRFGMPETLKTDNGAQFVSEELNSFCKQFGIELRRTTPYWPQANGEVERVNGMLTKYLKISQAEGTDWKWDLRMCVLMYNSSPHSTTGVAPAVLMFGRLLEDKLPALQYLPQQSVDEVRDRDRIRKYEGARYADHRRQAKLRALQAGDVVVIKRSHKENKLSSNFSPEEWTVVEQIGSDVKLCSKVSNRVLHRNIAHLKLIPEPDEEHSIYSSKERFSPDKAQPEQQASQLETDISTTGRPRRDSKPPSHLKDFSVG
ncbi:uncharacterized protein K02A2.6-like [Malaya genurostris]|uniref:uncharacterized protein K02A2.6-like n=1 Tax=Malaya genurostris TaxID=325434 RepID=UPI0026F38388|nr:uncharacterized protein K02A2.6-like [Malaya genurostris]